MIGRTTFIVAHRLSSLRRAERIAVLKAGRLVELGSLHCLLSQPDGEFARLQAQGAAGFGQPPVSLHHRPEVRPKAIPDEYFPAALRKISAP